MGDIFKFLKGNRTHILVVLGVLLTIAHDQKWISSEAYQNLIILTGGGALSALRSGVNTTQVRIEQQVAQVEAKVERVETKVESVAPEVARSTEQTVQAAAPGNLRSR